MSAPFMVERGDRMRMTFSGDKAKEALGGLVTNDVAALRPGTGHRAAALTPKGRVIALCRVFDRGSDLLVDCDAAAGEGFASMIRKFVNPRLAKYALVTDATDCLGVHGEGASAALVRALAGAFPGALGTIDAERLDALGAFDGIALGEGDATVYVVRSTDLSAGGFDLFGAKARIAELRATLAGGGLRTASRDEVRVLRVEAGVPEWGAEMDIETIPQEAVLDDLGAISFNKGCYTGQEVVARIHFRGHVNRLLRLLTSATPVAAGARVIDGSGTDVGDVRTSVVSPTRGALAIAMVRREVEPGSEVTVRGESGDTRATIAALTGALTA
jgi:folate-binding protein YgfZ